MLWKEILQFEVEAVVSVRNHCSKWAIENGDCIICTSSKLCMDEISINRFKSNQL